jgi:hypothetical protein
MKLHPAGMIEAHADAAVISALPSKRRSMHGMT